MTFPTSEYLAGLSRRLCFQAAAAIVGRRRPDLAERLETVEDPMYVKLGLDDGRGVLCAVIRDVVSKLVIATPDGVLEELPFDSSGDVIAGKLIEGYDRFRR